MVVQDGQQAGEARETLHFLDYWRVISSRKEVVIAVFLLIILTGIVVTFTMRKTFTASVLIQVNKETPDIEIGRPQYMRFDPLFLRTQFEIIQSRPVVEETIRRLNLAEKMGSAYGYAALGREKAFEKTVKILAQGMKVQQYRDTNLIEIQIFVSQLGGAQEKAPEEAARIANMVAEVFRHQSARRSRDVKVVALDALKEALEKRREEVAAAEQKVEDIRRKYEINLVSDSAGTDSSLDRMTLTQLENSRIMASQERTAIKSRYEKLKSLTPEDRLNAAQYVVKDGALAELVSGKRKAEVALQENLKDFGKNHPEVVRAQAVVEELKKIIDEALKGLMTGLRIAYETAQAQYDEVNDELEGRKTIERKAQGKEYREYEKASEELDHARKMRDMLEIRYMEEKMELSMPKTIVEVMDPAKATDVEDFVRPNHLLNIILSVLVGLAGGVALAFFVEYLDTSVKTIDDIEHFMAVPVLSAIPQKVRPFTDEGAHTTHAEAYRVLRANIQFSKKFEGGKVVCVTSGSVGEGKSLTIFNLGYICAQLGDRVIVVDGDLHRPTQHKILGVPNTIGLANVLAGEVEPADAIVATEHQNFHMLPSGKMGAGPHGLLDTTRLGHLVTLFKENYDVVLFDAPPIIGVSDTSLIVREMEGVLLVIQHRKYPRALSSRAKFMIENVGANLIGVVLNNLNISRDYSYYGYGYYSYNQYTNTSKKKS